MKRLLDGERKEIKASRQYSTFKNDSFKVVAHRHDCDTPIVELKVAFGADVNEGSLTHYLTDVEALDLIDRLQRALSVLPSSK
jgi:hypothetical protein